MSDGFGYRQHYPHTDEQYVESEQYVQQGGRIIDIASLIGQAVRNQFGTQLNPVSRMSTAAQGSLPGTITLQNPLGCDVPTGADYEIQLPILSPFNTDVFGNTIPGSAAYYTNLQTTEYTPGYSVAMGPLSTDTGAQGRLPFVTDFYVGEALGRKEWGTYDWKDGTGTVHKAVGTADPYVNKPEINVLYDSEFFSVNDKNELTMQLDGQSGGILAGLNISITPGPPPDTEPSVTMTASGVLTNGNYRWAISWRVKQADGTSVTSQLSPHKFGRAGGGYNSATLGLPAVPTTPKSVTYDGIYVWRNTHDAPTEFRLVGTVTSGLGSPQTFNDNISDGSLIGNTLFTQNSPTISTTTDMLLTGDPANVDTTPMGTITLGVWGLRDTVSGYSFAAGSDGTNSGAHLFFALDENHAEDLIFVGARAADGTTFTYPYNLYADWTTADGNGNYPLVSEIMFGSLQADGGVKTLVVSGADPVDADVLGIANGEDGVIAVRQDFGFESLWFRAGNAWQKAVRARISASSAPTMGDGATHPATGELFLRESNGDVFISNQFYWNKLAMMGTTQNGGGTFSNFGNWDSNGGHFYVTSSDIVFTGDVDITGALLGGDIDGGTW